MPSRIIRSHRGAKVLKDCLTSLMAMEAVQPSEEIYFISPWMTNSPVIDNSCNNFSALFPFSDSRILYLADILLTFSWAGSKVRLISNLDDSRTADFLKILGDKVECRMLENNHEKGMVTANFYLHGSMNFTFSGININGESIRITTERPEVNAAMLSVRERWKEATA